MARPKGVKDQVPRKPRECSVTLKTVGKKYGRMTITGIVSKGKSPRVSAICDCGKEKILSAYDVVYRKVVSCGCYHREEMSKRQIKPDNHSAKTRLYNGIKAGAEVRNYSFELTKEECYNIAKQNCYYCEVPPERELKTVGGSIRVNGIDRVDNEKGYTLDNCVSSCKKCNIMKHGVTIHIVKKIMEFIEDE